MWFRVLWRTGSNVLKTSLKESAASISRVNHFTLKKGATCSSETLLCTCYKSRPLEPEDTNLNWERFIEFPCSSTLYKDKPMQNAMKNTLTCRSITVEAMNEHNTINIYDLWFRCFKPGRSSQIFQGEKILSTPSFGRKVKPFVPCRIFAACKRTWKCMRGSRSFRSKLPAISRPSSSSFHY